MYFISAGVGRTGSYIAIDVELERAKTEGIIDVHNFVQLMRTQRINMVQTLVRIILVLAVRDMSDLILHHILVCGDQDQLA